MKTFSLRLWLTAVIFLALQAGSGCQAGAKAWGTAEEVVRGPDDDWAFELTENSREQLRAKKVHFSCAKLDEYIRTNDPSAAFYAIRDAALFDDRTCTKQIARFRKALDERRLTNIAVSFYFVRQGDKGAMEPLLDCFDREAMVSKSGPSMDHAVVSLFGFLPDWQQTGRRLLRHATHADGAAATVSGNALEWKRELFGNAMDYELRCEQAAMSEGIADASLRLCKERRSGTSSNQQ